MKMFFSKIFKKQLTEQSGSCSAIRWRTRRGMLKATLASLLFAQGISNVSSGYAQDDFATNDFFSRQQTIRNVDRSENGNGRRSEHSQLPRKHSTRNGGWEEFRYIDGSGNNLANPFWGKARIALRRRSAAAYQDGLSMPSGFGRANPRTISNLLFAQSQSNPSAARLSDMAWQWGQFLDHDITLTETALPSEPMPIMIPLGDPEFDPFAIGAMRLFLFRNEYFHRAGVTSPRHQINSHTAWIDGSQIYGSEESTMNRLRSFEKGMMLMGDDGLLPIDGSGFFLAGDVRANEQVGLTAMHTIFVREHNRIASGMAQLHPDWSDEEIFQRTRKDIVGILQAITYNQFIPAILGPDALRLYSRYRPEVDASITNEFATAAFRFGHSMLNENLLRLDNQGNELSGGSLPLRMAFFNPVWLQNDGVDPYISGLINQTAQEIDTQVVDDVRNFLFGEPGSGGLDLPAFNIQRGRDHGLCDYNTMRQYFGLPSVEEFSDITSDEETLAGLELAYRSVDDIDAWVGMLSEEHLTGRNVGPLMFQVMKYQFENLRDGDRFWYQRMMRGDDLRRIDRTTLSHVIYRNTNVRKIQRNVFITP